MDEREFENRMRYLSFFFTMLVIFAHAYNAELFLGDLGRESFPGRLESFLSTGVAQIAVPGFFLISSVLFFKNYECTWEDTKKKWNRRVQSLFIPYFLWNFLYYLGYVIASRIPGLSVLVGKGSVPLTGGTVVRAVFLYEYNYVFWFVFQLLLLTILSPAIAQIAKRRFLFLFSVFFLCAVILLRVDETPLNADALFYYLIGARLAFLFFKESVFIWEEKKDRLSASCLFLTALLYLVKQRAGGDLSTVLFRLFSVLSIWCILLHLKLKPIFETGKETFFIYAIHFALVRLINKSANLFLHGSAHSALALYLLMPLVITALSGVLHRFGKKYAARLYSCLNGGRM